MSSLHSSLIAPTAHPSLEQALRAKLKRRSETTGSLGELEPLAIRLGLIQNTLKPRFRHPQMLIFAGDHGIVVDGLAPPGRSTAELLGHLLAGRLPLPVFARDQGLHLMAVDAGAAEQVEPHPRLLARKIAHGTRNCRVGPAMSVEQAHAAIRAGMEIADGLQGNVLACAGIGIGTHETAALVLSRLTGVPVQSFILTNDDMPPDMLAHWSRVLQGALERHSAVTDPVEVIAAFGGFEIAMMVGAMLVASSKHQLLMIDGIAACAALLVASRIAAPVTDYCVFCRSHSHQGLDVALSLFRATALLELGMDSTDGTGAALAWPLVRCAAALLTEVAEGEDPGPSHPQLPAELIPEVNDVVDEGSGNTAP